MKKKCASCGNELSDLCFAQDSNVCYHCKSVKKEFAAAKSRVFISGKPGLKKDKKRRKEHNG
jgi:hypothetical protein